MTKKDCIVLARVLRSLGEHGARCFDDPDDRRAIAEVFADALHTDNPRFDAWRFMCACLPEVSNGKD